MFFMMGITQGRKDLAYDHLMVCEACGQYGRYQVYMTYMVLSLFFLPVFKWGKRYYAQTRCCSTLYELDPGIGRAIEHGSKVEIDPRYLSRVGRGASPYRRCRSCGYSTTEDFEYCPKCGQPFDR